MTPPSSANPTDDETYLRRAIAVAADARAHGNHPFGAILVGPDGAILLEAENTVITDKDCTGHAETNLMRLASTAYDRAFLRTCTLYTSTEPCAMCAGAIYWGNVGSVVFALSEKGLYRMTANDPENPSLDLPCREVFGRGQGPITVRGPLIEDEGRSVHVGFWGASSEV
jgi:tRNA(Arg) A34 adenosine deaminase TadA